MRIFEGPKKKKRKNRGDRRWRGRMGKRKSKNEKIERVLKIREIVAIYLFDCSLRLSIKWLHQNNFHLIHWSWFIIKIADIYTYIHTLPYIHYIHTYMHAYIHIYIHICIHTYITIHTSHAYPLLWCVCVVLQCSFVLKETSWDAH